MLTAALIYWCCIPPMRPNGGCGPALHERTQQNVEEEIRRAREELFLLRGQSTNRADPAAAPVRGPETIGP
ncbi:MULTISPECIES: hypothetical protein [unclassified Streptomyces]|uniref:hypothetical protein n=1 Tax=unclassified Streptomyces TaxID=2593676 RepID=UPI0033B2424B